MSEKKEPIVSKLLPRLHQDSVFEKAVKQEVKELDDLIVQSEKYGTPDFASKISLASLHKRREMITKQLKDPAAHRPEVIDDGVWAG